MRPALWLAIACTALAAQEAASSRSVMANDWCRIEFAAPLRARALEIMTATAPARARVKDRLGVDVVRPITLVVVRDVDEMESVVRERNGREPPEWAGGLALTDLDVVVIRADLSGEPFDRVDSIVTHELVHVALAHAQAKGQRAIPRWFEEGLAQWVAGRARPLDVPDLRPAATFGRLLDLDAMNAAFSQGEGAAARAYAQAESFVRFTARRTGGDGMRRIVELLLAGVSLDVALSTVTKANLSTSWGLWQLDLASDRSWMVETFSQILIAALILAVVAMGIARVMKRKRAIEAQWGDDREADKALLP